MRSRFRVALIALCSLWYCWSNVAKVIPDLPKPGDLSWHLDAARALLSGETPYRDLNYDYPPLAAFLALPLAHLDYLTARWIWFVTSHLLLLAAAYLIWRAMGANGQALCFVAVVWAFGGAARENLAFGQTGPLLVLLLAIAYTARRPASGFAIGFGFGLKLIPGVLGLPLLIERRWKAVAGAMLGGLLGFVLPWAAMYAFVGPKAPQRADYWMGTPAIMSWSIPSAVLRVLDPATKGPFLPFNWVHGNGTNNIHLPPRDRIISVSVAGAILLLGAASLFLLRRKFPEHASAHLMAALISLALAASPISWTHYQILQYPGLALLLYQTCRRRKWIAFAVATLGALAIYQLPVAVLTAYFNQYGRWTAESPATLYLWTNVTPAACLLLFGLHLQAARWARLSAE